MPVPKNWGWLMKRKVQVAGSQLVTVVLLEAREATLIECEIASAGEIKRCADQTWDPAPYQTDSNGQRLLEEIERRLLAFWKERGREPAGIVISLPGTLQGIDTIRSSSRLGIRESVGVTKWMQERLKKKCHVFHDVECLAIGENRYVVAPDCENTGSQCLVYIFADEGVGAKIIMNGLAYVGAGVAGILGRLIVQPDGAYYKALRSSGALEVFASRPWVSERLVSTYQSEEGKRGSSYAVSEGSKFRKALRIASERDWTEIPYDRIADGIAEGDPVADAVLEVAARYLGFAINSVITILNPHRIVLGGRMITELPGFPDRVVRYARQLSWPLAWNQTDISISKLGRDAQFYGAVELWRTVQSP